MDRVGQLLNTNHTFALSDITECFAQSDSALEDARDVALRCIDECIRDCVTAVFTSLGVNDRRTMMRLVAHTVWTRVAGEFPCAQARAFAFSAPRPTREDLAPIEHAVNYAERVVIPAMWRGGSQPPRF